MAVLESERILENAEPQPTPLLSGGTWTPRSVGSWRHVRLGRGDPLRLTPSHLSEYWLYGVFFTALGWAQLLWAVGIVLRSWRWLLLAGYAASTVTIIVWALSRTIGVWVGPHATVTEAARFPDILATTLEAVVAASRSRCCSDQCC